MNTETEKLKIGKEEKKKIFFFFFLFGNFIEQILKMKKKIHPEKKKCFKNR